MKLFKVFIKMVSNCKFRLIGESIVLVSSIVTALYVFSQVHHDITILMQEGFDSSYIKINKLLHENHLKVAGSIDKDFHLRITNLSSERWCFHIRLLRSRDGELLSGQGGVCIEPESYHDHVEKLTKHVHKNEILNLILEEIYNDKKSLTCKIQDTKFKKFIDLDKFRT